MLQPDDLRSLTRKDERYQRASAILKRDWPQLLVDFPRTNHYITLPDIAFAKRLSKEVQRLPKLSLDSFVAVQDFIRDFQSYLSSTVISQLKEPFL